MRRGDALGLGALADQFADAVAPDLSNRIRDGRWVTILAWCLVQSQQVFHASGGRAVMTRQEQNQRYTWLRPLELMWVARTISVLEKEDWKQRPLAGRRRVGPWVEKQSTERFGMSSATLAKALEQQTARHAKAPKAQTIFEAANSLFQELLNSNSGKTVLRKAANFPELMPGVAGKNASGRVLGVCEPNGNAALFMRTNQPDTVIKVFGSPFGPDVLVVTDMLSEGIDLHRYCRHLIHYELDPSPVRTVQRNGRIRRVNSWAAVTGKKIRYAYPAFGATRDQRLVEIVKKRVATFSLLLGGVPDFEDVDIDLTSAADEVWRSEVVRQAQKALKEEGSKLRARKPRQVL